MSLDTLKPKVAALIEKAEFMGDFWDGYQKNGTRTDYANAFGYNHFTNDTFYPKYDIVAKINGQIFRRATELTIDLIERLKSCNVTLDTSGITAGKYMFEGCGVTTIPTISLVNNTDSLTYAFNNCENLVTIEKLIVHKDQLLDNCFANLKALQNVIFEGEIGKNFKMAHSTKLTPKSVQSIFNCLLSTVTGQTLTLPPAFENADTEAVVTANIEVVDGVTRIKGKEGWTLVR